MENFQCKTKLICGDGAVSALKQMGIRRLFLVADPYFVRTGQTAAVTEATDGQVYIFDRVEPDPSVELVAEGVAQVRDFAPDTLVALGGGSAIDLAKAMGHFSGCKPRLIAIPTTSGSGSEVTDFAVLTRGSEKYPLVEESLRPEAAILDSTFLQKLPKALIADTGFDLLSHAAEAYVAKNAGQVTDALAKQAFCTGVAQLSRSYGGDVSVRLGLHQASAMAGMAFSQAGLGLCHALSHALGGAFHIPHGRLNAILLPEVVRCNAHIAGSKYAALSRAAGFGGSADSLAVRNLISGLQRLRRQLQLPESLAQAGIDPGRVRAQAAGIVRTALADPCCRQNPLTVEDYMVRRLLEAVTGRV